MNQELQRCEHLPPMRKTVIGQATVIHVGHESKRQFALGPINVKVAIFAIVPFFKCCVTYPSTGWGCKKPAAIGLAHLVPPLTVRMDRIGGYRSSPASGFDCRE